MFAIGFTWMQWVPLLGDDSLFKMLGIHVLPETGILFGHTLLACGLLIVLALVTRRQLERQKAKPGLEKYFTDPKLTARAGFEIYAVGVMNIMRDMMPGEKQVQQFFPLIGAEFLYIYANNLFGLLPGFSPPTDSINGSFGIAILVFILFNVVGFAVDWKSYLGHMWGPVFLVGFLLFPVELISICFRPVSLSVRLTGNIFGDHTAFAIISKLVPVGVPAVMLGLAGFVATVQAFIFTVLTALYIALAHPPADHEAHH